MEYVLTAKQMQQLDHQTIESFHIPSLVLMERAAYQVYLELMKNAPSKVLILCGTGNNGGDGLALARMLTLSGVAVRVLVLGDESKRTKECAMQADSLMRMIETGEFNCGICHELPNESFDLIVDCIFGIGLSREISGSFAHIIEAVNAIDVKRVAVDIPSGVHADTGQILGVCVHADETYAIAYRKPGMLLMPGKQYCGGVHVCDIGIVPFFDETTRKACGFCYSTADLKRLPKRNPYGNKGSYGKLGIIAGSAQIGGAALFAANSAYHMGCGYVRLFTHQNNYDAVLKAVPETVMTTYDTSDTIDETMQKLGVFLTQNSALVIGPGLGMSTLSYEIVKMTLATAKVPIIVDADACNLIAAHTELRKLVRKYRQRTGCQVVFTPHKAELARLCDCDLHEIQMHFTQRAGEASCQYDTIVCAKDAGSILVDEKRIYYNISGNDALATAGSGDVLSGIMGAMLAAAGEKPLFETAAFAMYLHGLLGEIAAGKYGAFYVTAGDLIACMPQLLGDERRKYHESL